MLNDLMKDMSLVENEDFKSVFKMNQEYFKILHKAKENAKVDLNKNLNNDEMERLILALDCDKIESFLKKYILYKKKPLDENFLINLIKKYQLLGVGSFFLNVISLLKKQLGDSPIPTKAINKRGGKGEQLKK